MGWKGVGVVLVPQDDSDDRQCVENLSRTGVAGAAVSCLNFAKGVEHKEGARNCSMVTMLLEPSAAANKHAHLHWPATESLPGNLCSCLFSWPYSRGLHEPISQMCKPRLLRQH